MAGKLIDIFQNCKCVKEEKHLAAGEVRSLAFGDNNTVMVVELGLHEVVSRKVIARAEKQIAEAGCRTRSDSVRVVEALVTASPEFFKG